ncbi:SDR family NAD(P)-dependent oxidoreductase [Halorubellus litoreus]|uniref:SDR family NAD(P)-dependent oxidoreductase n=1 Tax=Halorubellus litoreus TaxID=755308 RepID=A0ABD5VMV3_9EURY
MQLEGKTAIVTGGSSGIGYAIASAYVDEGANVVVANRNVDDGEAAANELGCTFVRTDVSDYEQVSALVDVTVEEFGALDVIVNNAGVGSESSVGDMTLEEWHRVVDVDLSGVMYGTKAALPHLLESEGFVVNVASIYGLVGGRGAAAYSAAKGGVVNFTQQVAVDYAEAGLNVNSICPGFVETPMTSELLESDRFYEILLDETPMNRPAQPEEIAPLAVFLASEGATYVTGANIPVDGGWTAH